MRAPAALTERSNVTVKNLAARVLNTTLTVTSTPFNPLAQGINVSKSRLSPTGSDIMRLYFKSEALKTFPLHL
jgi:hypothetical protein